MSITTNETDNQLEDVANRIMEYEEGLEQRIIGDDKRGKELVKQLNDKIPVASRRDYGYVWNSNNGLLHSTIRYCKITGYYIYDKITSCNHLLSLDTDYDWSRFINKEKNNNV